jgi:general secretion pathway protein E
MVRRICPDCSRQIEVPVMERMTYAEELGEGREKFYYGAGCELCSGTGYKGRLGMFEILHVTDALREIMLKKPTAADLRNQALKDGLVTLMRDGMLKVKANVTTPIEVLRNAYAVV